MGLALGEQEEDAPLVWRGLAKAQAARLDAGIEEETY